MGLIKKSPAHLLLLPPARLSEAAVSPSEADQAPPTAADEPTPAAPTHPTPRAMRPPVAAAPATEVEHAVATPEPPTLPLAPTGAPLPPLVITPEALRAGVTIDYHVAEVDGVSHTRVTLLPAAGAAKTPLLLAAPPASTPVVAPRSRPGHWWGALFGGSPSGYVWRVIALLLIAVLVFQWTGLRPPNTDGRPGREEMVVASTSVTPVVVHDEPTLPALGDRTHLLDRHDQSGPPPDAPTRRVRAGLDANAEMYPAPGDGPVLAQWPAGTVMRLNGGMAEVAGRHWVEVVDPHGRPGWIDEGALE